MKYLKIAVIYAVIVCVVYFSMTIGGDSESGIIIDQDSNLTALSSKINTEWGNTSQWDESIYTNLKKEITRSSSNQLISLDEKNRLLLQNRENAFSVIYNACDKEYSKSDCDKNILSNNMNGLDLLIVDDPNLENDTKVTNLKSWYSTYKNIRAFVTSTKGLNVDMRHKDGTDHQHVWADFGKYENRTIEKRDQYRRDPIYTSRLRGITELRDGLNNMELSLLNAKKRFCADLSKQLITYFENLPAYDRASAHTDFRRDYSAYISVYNGINETADENLLECLNNYSSRTNGNPDKN